MTAAPQASAGLPGALVRVPPITASSRKARPSLRVTADRRWLIPLFALFIAKQILVLAIIGPFTGHDEVDHFFYIDRLAAGGGLGVVGQVELPEIAAPYANYVADFPYNAEVIQPPLYHGLLAPIYALYPGGILGRLYTLRLVSVVLGSVALWLVYLIARQIFPSDAFMRVGITAFVALQPQFSFEAAIVNHDILVILLFILTGYLIQRALRFGSTWRISVAVGLVVAAGLWTKVSFGLVLPMVGVGLLFAAWDDRQRNAPWMMTFVTRGLVTMVLPLILVIPWFIRSYRLYGDPTGAQRLREIPEYGEQAQGYLDMLGSPVFWQGRLEDFWGNYGWRQVPFDPALYQLIWIAWGAALLGLLALSVRSLARRPVGAQAMLSRYQARSVTLWTVAVISVIFGVLYIGTIQFTQSRFAFPAMPGFALLTLLGWAVWVPARLRPAVLVIIVSSMLLMNIFVAIRVLIPYYYGPGGGALLLP
jgi:4-amino-4-deoxy-L-arabinose transferase-like glycosyltransferase